MMKLPTRSATPAKNSRKLLKNPSPDAMAPLTFSATSLPVLASKPAGATLPTRSASCTTSTPGLAVTQTPM